MKIDYSERAGRTLDDLASELRKAVYVDGMELERAMVAWTIFERLVKEGRADVVT